MKKNSWAETRRKSYWKNYFRGLKMRPTVPSDDEDADSFRFDPILRNPFLRLAADDVDALAAA